MINKIRIVNSDKILEKAVNKLLMENKISDLKELAQKNFSECVVKIEKEAHRIYKIEEINALKKFLEREGFPKSFAEKLASILPDLSTTISNIRRARAGSTSEKILRKTLTALGIPCEKGKIKRGGYRPDIVVPNNEVLKNNPEKGVAISVKRTLRERWAEDIDVFKFPNGKFVLITPDPDFKEDKVKDMIERGMKEIYIPDTLYDSENFVREYREIKRLSDLPKDLEKFK